MREKKIEIFRERGGSWRKALAYDAKDLPGNGKWWDGSQSIYWQYFDSQPKKFQEKVSKELEENGYYLITEDDVDFVRIPVAPESVVGSVAWNREGLRFSIVSAIGGGLVSFIAFHTMRNISDSNFLEAIFALVFYLSALFLVFGCLGLILTLATIIISGTKQTLLDEEK